jgi:hypothetical protein
VVACAERREAEGASSKVAGRSIVMSHHVDNIRGMATS